MNLREFVNTMQLGHIYWLGQRREHGLHVPGQLIQGWNTDDVVPDLIKSTGASTVIELGSWKGASAVEIGKAFQMFEPTLLCVDTWLGSAEHVTGTHADYDLIRPYGSELPLLHEFIRNICGERLDSTVFPFPATTSVAAQVLRHYSVTVDMVYVDAAHDYASVLFDLQDYWAIVKPGGVLVGDDYSPEWPGVITAVRHFASHIVMQPEIRGRKYIFRKPASVPADKKYGECHYHPADNIQRTAL